MRKISLLAFILTSLFSTIIYHSCKKDDPAVLATLSTQVITEITSSSAKSGGDISSNGGANVIARGVCWSIAPNPTIDDSFTNNGSGSGSFTSNLFDLDPGTTYYVRAYATNSVGTAYGDQKQFTTEAELATLSTSVVHSITPNSASSGGNITNDGGSTITSRGVCWSTSTEPEVSDNHTSDGTGTGVFSSTITDLEPGVTYYVRAYAINSAGTSYGSQVHFSTSIVGPTVTTNDITEIYANSALGGGNVTSSGGSSVTERGICWSLNEQPTTADYYLACGSGTGTFSGNMNDLLPGTTYYVKAYAINSTGTSYGDQKQFTTAITYPVVTTSDVVDINGTSATAGGNVTSSGGDMVSSRGVCYSTTINPLIGNSTVISGGSGEGSFSCNLSGLQPNTLYYIRAFATNGFGTAHGDEKQFTTPIVVPSVSTSQIVNITSSSASSGGNVTSNGGSDITARGVCWSTSQNPTIANSNTSNGVGLGSFTSFISGLQPGTTYYVRAYATNIAGTGYGSQLSFQTTATLPTVSTYSVSNILATSATGGGNVTFNGGATVTSRGICFNTTGSPTINNVTVNAGSGNGTFTAEMSLMPSTTYYVRAYATNSVGTSYGNQVSFITPPVDGTIGTVNDIQMNSYSTVYIGGKEWMTQNLRSTKYRNGNDIQNITDPAAWAIASGGAYAWYGNDVNNQSSGALYNWYAVSDSRGLCPTGWHIPSDAEWKYLEGFVDTEFDVGDAEWDDTGWRGFDAGKRLKSATGWENGLTPGTNDYGFNALPTGYRNAETGNFYGQTEYLTYWVSTQFDSNNAWRRYITYNYNLVSRDSYSKKSGHAIRCLKD